MKTKNYIMFAVGILVGAMVMLVCVPLFMQEQLWVNRDNGAIQTRLRFMGLVLIVINHEYDNGFRLIPYNQTPELAKTSGDNWILDTSFSSYRNSATVHGGQVIDDMRTIGAMEVNKIAFTDDIISLKTRYMEALSQNDLLKASELVSLYMKVYIKKNN